MLNIHKTEQWLPYSTCTETYCNTRYINYYQDKQKQKFWHVSQSNLNLFRLFFMEQFLNRAWNMTLDCICLSLYQLNLEKIWMYETNGGMHTCMYCSSNFIASSHLMQEPLLFIKL